MKLRHGLRSSVAAVAAVAVAVAGCSSGGTGSGGKGFTLRVGVVLPFTGDLSTYGPSLNAATKLAVDRINAALKKDGITDAKIQLVGAEDDQTSTSAGVEAATKLVQNDRADVLIGSMSSGVTVAVAQSVAIPNDAVLISPTSSDPSLTGLKDNDLVWRIYPSDTLQGAALAQAMGSAFGRTVTVNVGGRNDAFGVALVKQFEKRWTAAGGKVGKEVFYNPSEATYDSDAQRLASGNPKAWMIADFPPTFAKMGPALVRAGGWSPRRTFMTEAMDNSDALGKIGAQATEGLRGTAATAAHGADSAAFEQAFKRAEPKASWTGFEGTSFDAVVLAFLAALEAGSAEPDQIKANLRSVSAPPGHAYTWQQLPQAIKAVRAGKDIDYDGAWGPVNWDAAGDPTSSVYTVWQRTHGKIVNTRTFTFGK